MERLKVYALFLAVFIAFACSTDSSSSSSSCSESDSSTSSTTPLTLTIPSFDVDANGTCDLCNSMDVKLDNALLDYLNRTINCLLGKNDGRCNFSDPNNPSTELNMTKDILTGLITDLLGDTSQALFEFTFGLDPFVPDMCLALFFEDLDNDGKAFDYSVNKAEIVPDLTRQALSVVIDLAPVTADLRFRPPTSTGEEDCAVQSNGVAQVDPTDPSMYVADPLKFVTVNAKADIANLTLTMAVRALGGDPVSVDGNGNPIRPLNPGTQLALEIPYVTLGTGLDIDLTLPSNPDTLSQSFAAMLPFISLDLSLSLNNQFDAAVSKYFGPTPMLDASTMLTDLLASDSLGGLTGDDSSSSSSATDACAAQGGFTHPLTQACITFGLGFNFDFLTSCTMENGGSTSACEPQFDPGGANLKGGLGLALSYPSQFNCTLRPPAAAPVVMPINPLSFPGTMLGIGLHQDILSAVMYNAMTSGIACVNIDNATLVALGVDLTEMGLPDLFNTDTLGPFLWPDLQKAFPSSEVKFAIAPKLVDPRDGQYVLAEDTPTLLVGGHTIDANGKSVPADLLARIPHLAFGIQVDVDRAKNFQTAAEVDVGLELGVALDVSRKVTNDQGQPVLDSDGNPSWLMSLEVGIESNPQLRTFTFNTEVLDQGKKSPDKVVSELFGLVLSVAVGLDLGADINPNELLGITLPMFDLLIDPMGADSDSFPINVNGKTEGDDNGKGDYLGITLDFLDGSDADSDPDILSPKAVWTAAAGFMCTADPSEAMDETCRPILHELCNTCPQVNQCNVVRTTYCTAPPTDDTICPNFPNPTCPSTAPARSAPTRLLDREPDTFIQLADGRFGKNLVLTAVEAKQAGFQSFDSVAEFFGENGAREFSWKLDFGPWHFYTPDRYTGLPGLYEGWHKLQVKSRGDGRIVDGTPATLLFRMDTVGPEIRVLGDPAAPVGKNPSFKISVSDRQGPEEAIRVSHNLDGGEWSDDSDRREIRATGLAEGEHRLGLKAMDDAGNVTETSHAFVVDHSVRSAGGCVSVPGAAGGSGAAMFLPLLLAPLARRLRRRAS
ncbi:MAG: hypothetical protein HYY13_07990 [Nitrospirae bacterium]|nr:hypothetical protein [Nitrospirota bacterium]